MSSPNRMVFENEENLIDKLDKKLYKLREELQQTKSENEKLRSDMKDTEANNQNLLLSLQKINSENEKLRSDMKDMEQNFSNQLQKLKAEKRVRFEAEVKPEPKAEVKSEPKVESNQSLTDLVSKQLDHVKASIVDSISSLTTELNMQKKKNEELDKDNACLKKKITILTDHITKRKTTSDIVDQYVDQYVNLTNIPNYKIYIPNTYYSTIPTYTSLYN